MYNEEDKIRSEKARKNFKKLFYPERKPSKSGDLQVSMLELFISVAPFLNLGITTFVTGAALIGGSYLNMIEKEKKSYEENPRKWMFEHGILDQYIEFDKFEENIMANHNDGNYKRIEGATFKGPYVEGVDYDSGICKCGKCGHVRYYRNWKTYNVYSDLDYPLYCSECDDRTLHIECNNEEYEEVKKASDFYTRIKNELPDKLDRNRWIYLIREYFIVLRSMENPSKRYYFSQNDKVYSMYWNRNFFRTDEKIDEILKMLDKVVASFDEIPEVEKLLLRKYVASCNSLIIDYEEKYKNNRLVGYYQWNKDYRKDVYKMLEEVLEEMEDYEW